MTALRSPAPVTAAGAATRTGVAARRIAWTIALTVLAGCKSLSGFTGAAAGIAAGTFSSNPAVGIGVGVTVQAATDELINRIFRDMQRDEQNRIALLAADLPIGDKRPWAIHHRIPFHDERGTLQVVRDISTPLAQCREVLFSVDDDKHSQWFLTPLCQRSDGVWKWAAAEPATDRWGSLQ